METVVQLAAGEELHLLTDWTDRAGQTRRNRAAVLSVLTHIGFVLFVIAVPEVISQPPPRFVDTVVTPLIVPRRILTQIEPNPTKQASKVFDATDLRPRPAVKAPPGQPAPAPAPKPVPMPPVARANPPLALPEPPKIEAIQTPKLTLPVGPPQILPEEKPKPGFEDITAPRVVPPEQRLIPPSNPNVVAGAIDGNLRSHTGSGPAGQQGPLGMQELPKLLSDPQGVDFRPYLARVLAAVRRNWDANMPEASRMGRQGRVSLQFAIVRDGNVRKIVSVEQTGVVALDAAAIAAISMSSPFPDLPAAFKGTEIRVQINFAYNVRP